MPQRKLLPMACFLIGEKRALRVLHALHVPHRVRLQLCHDREPQQQRGLYLNDVLQLQQLHVLYLLKLKLYQRALNLPY
ncbi:hypothetical protein D3C86_1120900 [compost metagenome]